VGVSLTTPTGGPWDDITFNLYAPGGTPYAVGQIFILTEAYTGAPSALSSSTAGFFAESTSISGGENIFSPSVTLQPSTEYWFYQDQTSPARSFLGGAGSPFGNYDTYANGTTFQSDSAGGATFLLQGTPTLTPEPSSLLLLAKFKASAA
jgi:hypothetical protein